MAVLHGYALFLHAPFITVAPSKTRSVLALDAVEGAHCSGLACVGTRARENAGRTVSGTGLSAYLERFLDVELVSRG